MSNKEKILDLYYNQHLKQNKIAKIVGTTSQYVSKIVRADSRIKEEKETRKQENKEKRTTYLKDYFKTYIRPKKDDEAYRELQAQLEKDSLELSYASGFISDYAFEKWNSSIYHRNSKGNLSLIRGVKIGADLPRTINMNIKVSTQKYRNRCCVSR